jgi:hypothetical protein
MGNQILNDSHGHVIAEIETNSDRGQITREAEFERRLRNLRWQLDCKKLDLQSEDGAIKPYLRVLIEFLGVPSADDFLSAFEGGVRRGPSLTPMRKLERLAVFLMVSHLPQHVCRSRLHAARAALLESSYPVRSLFAGIETQALGLLSVPHTRRTLLAAATAPLLQGSETCLAGQPLELSPGEKANFRRILKGTYSTNGEDPRFHADSLGDYLCSFLDADFSLEKHPPPLCDIELSGGLGLPMDSLNQLESALATGEYRQSHIEALLLGGSGEFYGPAWTKLHKGTRHRIMLGNTAVLWGNLNIPLMLVQYWGKTPEQAARSLLSHRQPRIISDACSNLQRFFLKAECISGEGYVRLQKFFEDILFVAWDLN